MDRTNAVSKVLTVAVVWRYQLWIFEGIPSLGVKSGTADDVQQALPNQSWLDVACSTH